jgi:hypothetical protein
VYGLGFILIPNQFLSLYGVELNEPGIFVARYFGSALLGVAVTWFTARKAKSIEAMTKGGLLGGLVLGATGLIVALWDALAGPANSFIWINPVLYAFIAIGFGYFYFKK